MGVIVPNLPRSIPLGALDRDGDGRLDLNGDMFEDDFGTRDDDWDNDNGQPDDPATSFRDTGTDDVDEDDDNDGIPDWNDPTRGGPHVPGPPADLPPLMGRDTVEFLFDSDGDGATGYSPDGYLLGADYRVLVDGRNGRAVRARFFEHVGENPGAWDWRAIDVVDHAMDSTRLEVGVPLDLFRPSGNLTILVRATGWTGAKDWSDRLLESERTATGQLEVGSEVGAIDPFAVTESGGFSISPTGTAWTDKDGPADAGAIIDMDVGRDGQAGYTYALTSRGKVMVTSRAVTGWSEYGQGSPTLPTASSYVAMATGRGNLVGYVYVLSNDGSVYACERATCGWTKYGQGSPSLPTSTAWVDLATGGDGLEGYVYIL